MALQYNFRAGASTTPCTANPCVSKDGCPAGVTPDFTLRRHDTMPDFKIRVEECDGEPMNVQGLLVEVSMWAKAKLKKAITTDDTYFALADCIGFDQVMMGDIIVMDRVRLPEFMLVTGFDEENKFIQVERGYRSTTPSNWKKGACMRIFRIMNAPGQTELVFEDVVDSAGVTTQDVLTEAYLVYNWSAEDTCTPGCFWMEFKLIKMSDLVLFLPGGYWTGDVYQDDAGVFWTGSASSDAQVQLSYDAVNDVYLLSDKAWPGEFHLYSATYYTGTEHGDGSVPLNRTDVPSDSTVAYDSGIESETSLTMLAASVTPSFTPESYSDPDAWPHYFGCLLGEGIEWERRFPICGEGFLVKIVDSPTADI
jgi:hypothetical protein